MNTKSVVVRRIENLSMSVVSVLIVLALVELVFWANDIRGVYANRTRIAPRAMLSPAERVRDVSLQFRPNTEFSLNYDGNPRGYFDENNGIVYHINDDGFRGPDFEPARSEGTTRVVVLGDSFTFGEGVFLEDTFCTQLEAGLNARMDGAVEVLNLGVSGWNTKDEIRFFEQRGYTFRPDVVLLVYVLNDAVDDLDMWIRFRQEYENPALKDSYLLSYLSTRLNRRKAGRKYVEEMIASASTHQEAWDESFAYLVQGAKLAKSIGASFGVAVFPFMFELNEDYPFRDLHNKITRFCNKAGIPVIDLMDAFEGESYLKLWVHPSDQHPNERGHAIAAKALQTFLLESGLL